MFKKNTEFSLDFQCRFLMNQSETFNQMQGKFSFVQRYNFDFIAMEATVVNKAIA